MKPAKKLILSLLIPALSYLTLPAQADDFATVKSRVTAELMKAEVDDNRVKTVLEDLQADGSYPDINYSDLSRTAGFPHRLHTANLVYLARAYKNPESEYYADKSVLEKIVRSLTYWVDHDFFGDNWHNNQISTPTNLVDLMLILGEELPKELVDQAQPIIGRAHMNASGARPSGDRIVIAGILAKNLLFTGDQERFDEVIRIIEGELKFSTGQRGIQRDYSFHHRVDRVNNTTSYGYGKYANAFGEWSYYVAGTKYAFSREKINQLVDYYLDGICKQLVYGIYEDISVKNRSISHKATFQPKGLLEIERLIYGTNYRRDELEEILMLRKGTLAPSRSFAKFFWQTEHFVFQRPNFYTTVRMYSTRNRNMEKPYNGPGKTTHHRADGTNYLQLKGDEYHNIWPVYDWQKISGTTILQKPELHSIDNIQLDGVTDFVGAVTDGLYGAVAFDFISPHDGTKARKSWFFFDEEYVCLGAGIASYTNLPVATTVNQVLLRSDVSIMREGKEERLAEGERQLEKVKWVYQDKIGYIFPEPATVMLSNQTEQGRWSDITDQKNISEELVEEKVFTLWYDHGRRPENATYQYIVVPDVRKETLAQSSIDNRSIQILANTRRLQAVKNDKLNMYQMAFYTAGTLDLSDGKTFTMNSQGMAMVKMEGDRISELTLADPSRQLRAITLIIPGVYEVEKEDVIAFPNDVYQNTTLVVNLPQEEYAGKSVIIKF